MIPVKMQKQRNTILNEDMVVPRVINTQTVDFNDWCSRMANGSTVTAADVAAVMQQIENKLPETLSLNAKVICSPNGLVFRPKVSGSLTQSELKAKLEARKAAETDPEKAAKIDVNRAISTSDLAISECKVSIVVDLPKTWSTEFNQKATLKRVSNGTAETSGETVDDTDTTDDETQGGEQSGGNTGGSSNSGSGDSGNTGGSGDNTGGGDNGGGGGDDGPDNN